MSLKIIQKQHAFFQFLYFPFFDGICFIFLFNKMKRFKKIFVQLIKLFSSFFFYIKNYFQLQIIGPSFLSQRYVTFKKHSISTMIFKTVAKCSFVMTSNYPVWQKSDPLSTFSVSSLNLFENRINV